jgi:hypothetical protein
MLQLVYIGITALDEVTRLLEIIVKLIYKGIF